MSNGTDLKNEGYLKKIEILVGFIVGVLIFIFSQMTEAKLQYYINKKTWIRKKILEIFDQTDLYAEERED